MLHPLIYIQLINSIFRYFLHKGLGSVALYCHAGGNVFYISSMFSKNGDFADP